MKICTKCKREKDLSHFYESKTNKSGFRPWCKECTRLVCNKWTKSNLDKVREKSKVWRQKNPDKKKEYNSKYRSENPQVYREASKNHRKKFPQKILAYNSARHKRNRQATPVWLSETHKKKIQAVYSLAKSMTKVLGRKYSVDHVVPLKGDNVCGLHVPWNLEVCLFSDNSRKRNTWDWESQS